MCRQTRLCAGLLTDNCVGSDRFSLSSFFYVNGTHGISVCQSDANNHFTRVNVLLGHKRCVRQMQCHPSKPLLVSCGDEGIFVWDLNKHTCVKQITSIPLHFLTRSETTCPDAHEEDVECMIWLYDGSVLATGGCDSTVKLWDVEREFACFTPLTPSFAILETINAHKSNVSTLAFSAAQDYLVTAGRDSSINLWSTQTLRPEVLAKRVVVWFCVDRSTTTRASCAH